MKKKSLKLSLNKEFISNLQAKSILGGRQLIAAASEIDGPGCMSDNGCTTGPDETMTCGNWSCACNY